MFGDRLFVFLLLFVFVASVECTTCNSMDIRNNLTHLNVLRDCTEIVGSLKILLMEKATSESDFEDYVFPNLTKITGYLFFFQVKYLTSIGKLFPNLQSVRGYDLFTDYSIVFYDMPHLREIGLKNLTFVARGFVKVDKCPQLCYVDTIDWHSIGTELHFTNTNNGTCEPCPRECLGNCWNYLTCQEKDSLRCHQECMGCYKNDSATDCRVCKNYEHKGTCVPECANNTSPKLYTHSNSYKCLTEEECKKFNGTWWIFQGACINECPLTYEAVQHGNTMTCHSCGSNCTKWCLPDVIDSMDKLHKFKGCTHINGSLTINLAGVSMAIENEIVKGLSDNLGSVRYIRDSLVVTWTKAVRSLNFLRNLMVIDGMELRDKTHAVVLRQNQILQKLWDFDKDFTLKIRNGTLGVHYNSQLCLSEIRKLAIATGLSTNFSTLDVYGNGDKSSCNFISLNVTVNATSSNVTLSWPEVELPTGTYCLGFTVYYIEHEYGTISTLESKDVCDGRGWRSQFSTNKTSIFLANLSPFTTYAYYIKMYQTSMEGAKTNVSHFKTLPDDPEVVAEFSVTAEDYQSIKLMWSPPRLPTGELSHYKLYAIMEPDLPVQWERDYCLNPRTEEGDDIDRFDEDRGIEDVFIPPEVVNRTVVAENCSCSGEIQKEPEIEMFLQRYHIPLCDLDSQSKFGFDKCRQYLYTPISQLKKGTFYNGIVSKRDSDRNSTVFRSPTVGHPVTVNISADLRETVLNNFTHYTLYVFYFSACNKGDRCGPVSQSFTRTKRREDADDVASVKTTVEDTNVTIDWTEPKNPNSMVLSYNIEYQKTDVEHSKPTIECLSRNKQNSTNTWSSSNMLPGEYTVRVQAVSLAGPGRYSRYAVFEIEAPDRSSKWVIPLVTITFVIVISAVLLYLWYKRKNRLDNIHLIATINPDYDGAVYIEDEWEVDRSDIDLLNALGHGTFGTVYCGLIKSRNLACAVKTVNENVSLHERMEFLNEASVMKAFSQSHHVVKLLGVVSRGQPPLVIMELMERGDLKKYLRSTRDSSQNITANEIYRMSIEIADGMSYLSAKKFVHRDLAARNCMVGYDRTVKIGDFGMARDVYETDYYRKETKGLLPVRWMAPESLADGIFSSDSDVWSYGIVLWEIATLAEQPYQGLSNEQVLQFVVSKGKLERPPECPDLLYEIMDACWCWRPNDRPTFADIVERLEDHVGQDFKLVSFIHSREGLEHKVTHGCQRAYNPPALGMGAQEHDLFGSDYNEPGEVTLFFGGSSSRPRFLSSSSQRRSPSDLY